MIKLTTRKYGWKKDKPDPRDQQHNFAIPRHQASIPVVDLRSLCPPVYDQQSLGSCTANAIAAAYQFDEMKEKEKEIFTPSRLFIYYNERKIEGSVKEDSGGALRDGVKSINTTGVCSETDWPYDVDKFTVMPPMNLYAIAKKHKCVQYKRVKQDLEQFKQCLIEGYPFVFGMQVFDSFESDKVASTGIVPMPANDEENLGGHAVLCVGFDDTKKMFIVRNSWGDGWGMSGYFYLPYDYMTSDTLTCDFWTVRQVDDTVEQIHVQPKVYAPTVPVSISSGSPVVKPIDKPSPTGTPPLPDYVLHPKITPPSPLLIAAPNVGELTKSAPIIVHPPAVPDATPHIHPPTIPTKTKNLPVPPPKPNKK